MKKLLSLLSILTISGTAIPTTIAASLYQKQETIKNNDIDLQTNNLKRYKRQSNQQISNNIVKLTDKLIINYNSPQEYINSSRRVLQNLVRLRILIPVINVGQDDEDSIIYTLNNANYGYFRLPVEIIEIDQENQRSYQRNLELVLRTDNLYLQGFINHYYYHFNFNRINRYRQPQSVKDDLVPLLTQIKGMESRELRRIGPDYRDLLPVSNNRISWNNIYSSFLYLTNNININEGNVRNATDEQWLARSLGHVIFSTSEAIRFRNIYNIIHNDIINNNRITNLTFRDGQIYQILVNWGSESRRYRSLLFNEQNGYQEFEQYGIDRFIHNIIGSSEFSFIHDLTPIDTITEYLRNFNTRILLGVVLPHIFRMMISNCNNYPRSNYAATEFENSFWKEQFCDSKPQIEKIDGEVKVIKILNEHNRDNNLEDGDIFVGTTEGLYLIRKNGVVLKVDNIDAGINSHTEITSIKEFGNKNFYVSTNDKKVYFLNTKNLVEYNRIVGEILLNIESSNLKKELIIYYDQLNKEKVVSFYLRYGNEDTTGHIQTLNLNKIIPIENYEKIDFLGNVETYASWGKGDSYPSETTIQSYVKDKNLKDLIINKEITNNGEAENNSDKVLQSVCDKSGIAGMCIKQSFGLTWYWNNKDDNYYFQVIGRQYGETWSSFSGGGITMHIGNGIKLYSD